VTLFSKILRQDDAWFLACSPKQLDDPGGLFSPHCHNFWCYLSMNYQAPHAFYCSTVHNCSAVNHAKFVQDEGCQTEDLFKIWWPGAESNPDWREFEYQ